MYNSSSDSVPSDSSDDEVCFGPYTMKEAKKDVLRYNPRIVNRRHTSICKLSESQMNKSNTEDIPGLANTELLSNSITKCSSEYLTANESVSTDSSSQNAEFLEKLNKVINEPLSEASSYNTAFDLTNVRENKHIQYDDTFLERFQNQTSFVLDNVHQTLVENTLITTEESNNKGCNSDVQNDESCSYGENSSIIIVSDDSLSEFYGDYEWKELSETNNDKMCVRNSKASVQNKVLKHSNSSRETETYLQPKNQELYSLYYNENKVEESSFGFQSLNVSDLQLENDSCNIRHEDSYKSSNSPNSSKNSSCNLNLPHPASEQRFEKVIIDCHQLSKISEKTEFTTCVADSSNIKQPEETRIALSAESLYSFENEENLEIQRKYVKSNQKSATAEGPGVSFDSGSEISQKSNVSTVSEISTPCDGKESAFSPISLPTICLEQHDDSCQFDDTLEEMNRLLAEGIDYEMPEVTHSKNTSFKEQLKSDDIISASFMNNFSNVTELKNRKSLTGISSTNSSEKCKKFYSTTETKPLENVKELATTKYRYQQRSILKPLASPKNVLTKQPEKLEVDCGFKVPTKPIKKLTTPSKIPNPVLKNVVSPVGIYIRHSPKYSPIIRVPQNTRDSHKNISKVTMLSSTSVKENIPGTSNQEFPSVIYKPAGNRHITEEKKIVLPRNIKKLINEQVVTKHEKRIIQSDKYNESIERRLMEPDLSIDLSHNNQDISILTHNQPFSIKKM